MARLVAAGESPTAISRRLLVFAAEDVGNADPRGLQVAVAADQAVRAVGVAHQFLSKPCDSERLQRIIERALQLREQLRAEPVQRCLGAIDTLPPMPSTSAALRQALADPDVDLGEVGDIIARDASLTAKLLQLVNSSLFGLARPVSNMRDAATYLGLTVLRHLTLSTESFRAFRGLTPPPRFKLEEEQAHAFLVGRMAGHLVDDPELKEEAFLAGILTSIGRLIVAYKMTDVFVEVEDRAKAEDRAGHELERELLGASHAQLGAYLLGIWGLPDSIVEAVAFHHEPALLPHAENGLIEAVHLAAHFAGERHDQLEPDGPRRSTPLDLNHLEAHGLLASLDELRSRALDAAHKADAAA